MRKGPKMFNKIYLENKCVDFRFFNLTTAEAVVRNKLYLQKQGKKSRTLLS